MNHDGRPDLIWQHLPTGTIAAWLLNGTRLVDGMLLSPRVPDPVWRVRSVVDFNGDGESDLLWQHPAGGLALWYMRGTQLLDGAMIQATAPPHATLAAVVDVDVDGFLDFVWHDTQTGALSAWLMEGLRRRTIVPYGPGPVADTGWKGVGPR
jgi:hypothetical protein